MHTDNEVTRGSMFTIQIQRKQPRSQHASTKQLSELPYRSPEQSVSEQSNQTTVRRVLQPHSPSTRCQQP